MPFIRDVHLKPVSNGFKVRYDYLDKEGCEEECSVRYISTREEVFSEKDGKEAFARLIELSRDTSNLDFFTAEGEEIAAVTPTK
jgi:hypothetical protein